MVLKSRDYVFKTSIFKQLSIVLYTVVAPECSLMCNVNVVNRISCFCLIFFLERIGVALATPWLRPWIMEIRQKNMTPRAPPF